MGLENVVEDGCAKEESFCFGGGAGHKIATYLRSSLWRVDNVRLMCLTESFSLVLRMGKTVPEFETVYVFSVSLMGLNKVFGVRVLCVHGVEPQEAGKDSGSSCEEGSSR